MVKIMIKMYLERHAVTDYPSHVYTQTPTLAHGYVLHTKQTSKIHRSPNNNTFVIVNSQ